MKFTAVIPAFMLLACACDRAPEGRTIHLPANIVVSKPQFATQRFIPTNSADVAFDTKTGSLCRTWDWRDPEGTPTGAGLAIQTSTCDRLYQYDQENELRKTAELTRAAEAARDTKRQ